MASAIVLGHGLVDALGGETLYGIYALEDGLFDEGHLGRFPFAEDKLYLAAFGEVVSDAEPEAGILVVGEGVLDALKAVVAGIAAGGAYAEGAEGQGELIYYNQHIFYGQLLLIHPVF